MIIQKNEPFFKGSEIRFSPNKQEGRYIKYLLNQRNFQFTDVSHVIGVSRQAIQHTVYGRRRSRRVETAIAEILGHEDWNSVVTEARLATSGASKPTLTEIAQAKQEAIDKYIQRRIARRQKVKDALSEAAKREVV